LAQKYIEKPLIFKQEPFLGRKFDIRVWVLVVGSRHPKIYYHEQFYGRICFEEYQLTGGSLKNEAMHLSNYSRNKDKFIDGNRCAQSVLFPEQLFRAVK
jgi:tubulin polyglutamylase TTLL6/13